MTDAHTLGGRVLAVLASIATLITIGGLGHCMGVERSSDRIEKLQAELNSLRGNAPAEQILSPDLHAALSDCSSKLTACEQNGDRLKIHLASLRDEIPSSPAAASNMSATIATSSTQEPAAPDADASASVKPTAEVRGFRFELQSCFRRGGEVRCNLMVTSLDTDTELALANAGAGRFRRTAPAISTRLVDDTGFESFSSGESSLGTATGPFPGARLTSDIPMNLSLHFPDVPPAAKRARLLEMVFTRAASSTSRTRLPGFGTSDSEEFTVELRDIPIEQR